MFPLFAHVPAYPFVFVLFWGAALFFALAMARHLRVFAAARAAGPSPLDNVPARLVGLIEYAFVQTKMFKDPRAALLHWGIFWGFVLLTSPSVRGFFAALSGWTKFVTLVVAPLWLTYPGPVRRPRPALAR